MTAINRRKALTIVASVPAAAAVAAVPVVGLCSGVKSDPVFAAIAAHKAAGKNWNRAAHALDLAESAAEETHGHRPLALIHWHEYHIGGGEIDWRYEWFLRGGADPDEIKKEYVDAKRRYREAVQAGKDWDRRAGVASIRKEDERALAAYDKAARLLAKTKPTTAAGGAALLAHILRDMDDGSCPKGWHTRSIRTVAAALSDGAVV
jgi:hypothetical protein